MTWTLRSPILIPEVDVETETEMTMTTATVIFEATGTSCQFDLKAVRALADYHRNGQVGRFTNRERTEFVAPAPTSKADFEYMLSKVR